MPASAEPVTFALLGHQESWDHISRVVQALRTPDKPPLADATLREIVPWIPPRRMVRLGMRSLPDGQVTPGAYVETFITPDELAAGRLRQAIGKVDEAIGCAARAGARIAALGGFTSIVLEGRGDGRLAGTGLALTTGNSLTAALIVKGLERAAAACAIPLADATLLLIGATGDIGTACARYFAGRTSRLLLCARRADRLEQLAAELRQVGAEVEVRSAREALPEADAVIAVASLAAPEWDLASCRPDAIVCDAGYPKNLRRCAGDALSARVFHGGMGRVTGGWTADNSLLDAFYRFPDSFVAHGCMLEAIVLAMEERFEPFSHGRGRITPAHLEEIWAMAARHGVGLAPLFNHDGCWALDQVRVTG